MRWLLVAIGFCGAVCTVLPLPIADEAEKPSLLVLVAARPLIFIEGETKSIFCKGRNLEQKLEWISPSGEIVGKKSKNNSRVYNEYTLNEPQLSGLFLKNITAEDSGEWTCRSGDELSQTITLQVVEKVNVHIKETTVVGEEDDN